MTILDEIKHLKTGNRNLRKFGLTVGGVFAGLGMLLLWRHNAHWPYFLWPGLALVVAGLVQPRLLKWIYIAWMSAAFALGFVMANVILVMFYFLIVTPIGLVARICGQDFLSLKLDPAARSYWISRQDKTRSPADYERQF